MNFFKRYSSSESSESSKSSSYPYPFSKNYRRGYKNAWIDNIKDYTP